MDLLWRKKEREIQQSTFPILKIHYHERFGAANAIRHILPWMNKRR